MKTKGKYIEINQKELIPDPINKTLDGEDEPVDMELVKSIQVEGLQDPS